MASKTLAPIGDRLLTAKAVTDKLKISRTTLGWLLRRGFPRAFHDTQRWRETEVDQWLRQQPKKHSLTRKRGER